MRGTSGALKTHPFRASSATRERPPPSMACWQRLAAVSGAIAVLTACGGSPPPPPDATPKVAPLGSTVAAPPPEASTVPAGGVPKQPMKPTGFERAARRALENRWLVVVGSGDSAPPLDDLGDLKLKPERVSSSRYVGLAPCQDLLVATSADREDDARFQARKIASTGLPVEVVFADRYVGPDARIDDYCDANEEEAPMQCGDLHFIVSQEGDNWLALDASVAELRAAMAEAGEISGAGAWWSAPLPDSVAGHAVGDVWQGVGMDGEAACKVTELAAVTRGISRSDITERPTCGLPQLFAKLGCKDEGLMWAVPHKAKLPLRLVKSTTEPSPTALAKAMVSVNQTELLRSMKSEAGHAGHAKTSFEVRKAASEGSTAMTVQGTVSAGGDETTCGGPDVARIVLGVVSGDGEPRVDFREATAIDGFEILDLEGDGKLELFELQWPGIRTIRSSDGSIACRLPIAHCANPCANDAS
jgi:hypothetical protein